MRGDINAIEVYQDRKFQTQLGYGIFDVPVGSTGDVGFEDVLKFSYVGSEEEDPKLYRRKVFQLVGHYYPNDLARILWARFAEHQAFLHEQTGVEISLEESAKSWLQIYGHSFFKVWALRQPEVPFRMRNGAEPQRGWIEVGACQLIPAWRELIEAGFSLDTIALANLTERAIGRNRGQKHYLRVVARLSGHRVKDEAELQKRQREIEQLEKYLSKQSGYEWGIREATIEYYRRLSLVAEIESKQPTLAMAAS